MNLKVKELTPEIFVDRDQLVSMEFDQASNYYGDALNFGTVITLVNGRKIYVANMKPNEIYQKLNE